MSGMDTPSSISGSGSGAVSFTAAIAALRVPIMSSRRFSIRLLSVPFGSLPISGAAILSRRALPSNVSKSTCCLSCSNRNSGRCRDSLRRFSKPSRPSCLTRVSGSSPSGKNKKRACTPSLSTGRAVSMARAAAVRPALSPSKQKITSGTILNKRRRWCSLVAVPRVATA